MTGPRVLGVVCGALLLLAAGEGCGTSDGETSTSPETIAHANVALTLHDASGTRVGEGSGILIAPRLVLTSGHLVAGVGRWSVKTKDGKTASGVRGLTYDWMVYNSNLAHPRKHDVALIYLDQPIQLSAYPKVATSRAGVGAPATRIRGTGAGFETLPAKLDRFNTFPHAYVSDIPQGEVLDTGGAVLDSRNNIVGVVTGRGLTTGKLHIARTDSIAQWIAPKAICAGGASTVRTYDLPDGGSSGTSGSTGSSSGSDGPPTSSGGSSSGNGGCPDGGGNPWGSSGGTGSSSGGSSGNDGTPGSSTSGSGSSSGASGSSSGGSSGSYGTPGTSTSSSGGSGTSGSSSGTSGTSGIPGTSTSSGGSGTSGSTSTSSGGSDAPPVGGDGETCTGTSDNPDVCPPEPDGCSGPTCGGGTPDNTIDYGGYGGGGSDAPPVVN